MNCGVGGGVSQSVNLLLPHISSTPKKRLASLMADRYGYIVHEWTWGLDYWVGWLVSSLLLAWTGSSNRKVTNEFESSKGHPLGGRRR